jgi:hypothetical protein
MSTTTLEPTARADVGSLRMIRIGVPSALAGLVMLWAASTFMSTVDQGDFEYAGDYWLTSAALPLGAGLILHALAVHRLQHGRDGRLGAVGTWFYVLCCTELVVQCMSSVVVGAELRWGPTYVVSTLGTFVGLGLIAAGSWRVRLLPRWLLGIWPPVGLLGSWFGMGPIPLLLGAFLVTTAIVVHRRVPDLARSGLAHSAGSST